MKTPRFCLLLSMAVLIVGAATGCINFRPSQPQALFTATAVQHVVPFTASFDGTLSFHPDGEIVTYLWTFGDGATDSGPIVDHTFLENGTYDVRLTVIDKVGVSHSTWMEIEALNPPPVAGFSYGPRSDADGFCFVSCSEVITFNAAEWCSDDGEIVSYEWYFGYRNADQSPATAEGVEVTHRFLYPGTYSVTLTVTDDDGGQTLYVERIIVEGLPPCNADITGDLTWNVGGGTCQ
jgi:PKD repeat protein